MPRRGRKKKVLHFKPRRMRVFKVPFLFFALLTSLPPSFYNDSYLWPPTKSSSCTKSRTPMILWNSSIIPNGITLSRFTRRSTCTRNEMNSVPTLTRRSTNWKNALVRYMSLCLWIPQLINVLCIRYQIQRPWPGIGEKQWQLGAHGITPRCDWTQWKRLFGTSSDWRATWTWTRKHSPSHLCVSEVYGMMISVVETYFFLFGSLPDPDLSDEIGQETSATWVELFSDVFYVGWLR